MRGCGPCGGGASRNPLFPEVPSWRGHQSSRDYRSTVIKKRSYERTVLPSASSVEILQSLCSTSNRLNIAILAAVYKVVFDSNRTDRTTNRVGYFYCYRSVNLCLHALGASSAPFLLRSCKKVDSSLWYTGFLFIQYITVWHNNVIEFGIGHIIRRYPFNEVYVVLWQGLFCM